MISRGKDGPEKGHRELGVLRKVRVGQVKSIAMTDFQSKARRN